jgi:hypothetical protein
LLQLTFLLFGNLLIDENRPYFEKIVSKFSTFLRKYQNLQKEWNEFSKIFQRQFVVFLGLSIIVHWRYDHMKILTFHSMNINIHQTNWFNECKLIFKTSLDVFLKLFRQINQNAREIDISISLNKNKSYKICFRFVEEIFKNFFVLLPVLQTFLEFFLILLFCSPFIGWGSSILR